MASFCGHFAPLSQLSKILTQIGKRHLLPEQATCPIENRFTPPASMMHFFHQNTPVIGAWKSIVSGWKLGASVLLRSMFLNWQTPSPLRAAPLCFNDSVIVLDAFEVRGYNPSICVV